MQEQIPHDTAKAVALFGKIPDVGKKMIDAYGLGLLHGEQIAKEGADKEQKSA